MSVSVTLKSYFYEVLIPSSQKNTSSPIEDILHHVSISFMKKLALYKCFNPRTHTGCDGSSPRLPLRSKCFNPRTHTGCDFCSRMDLSSKIFVSIHAPTRGATSPSLSPRIRIRVSIHAPTRGATLNNIELQQLQVRFNPRTHTGCDIFAGQVRNLKLRFNPRTHTGCDLD